MDDTYSVYRHTCPNGKTYIGITKVDVASRWRNGLGYNEQVFGRAIKKYGWENIKHEVVCEGLSQEEAFDKERELIKEHKSNDPKYGYNRTDGGDGARGYIPTEQVRAKLSASAKALWADDKIRGRFLKHLRELNESRVGKSMQKESVRKSAVARGKSVCKYSLNGEYLETYLTAMDAAQSVGKSTNSDIVGCCRHKRNYAQGYIWRYVDECKECAHIETKDFHKPRNTKVAQFTPDGELVSIYESQMDIEKRCGFHRANINKCLKGERKTAYGYKWQYGTSNINE